MSPIRRALSPIGQALIRYHHRTVHLPRVDRLSAVVVDLVRQLERRDGATAVRTLLDVGSGDGRIARGVAARLDLERAVGVDILARPEPAIETRIYDGRTLPCGDQSFDVVSLLDVLHHAEQPAELLRECLRVARRAVVLKDHLSFGYLSDKLLELMDHAGNAGPGVAVRGTYWQLPEWFELVREAGGRITAMRWPLTIHNLPWRLITRSELQFAALIERCEVP